ncbi:O-Antigen ligase [Rubripirellula amarantea]|uniref:O-Antigen ligase n=1 Tax=Rubripirellula amarantea TaxID=2527999 RepID=A0A5C5WVT3_9BACT|nr:O-antigen ligase family protein [Rubripirellula amarantea]TWT54670.1 O-Antigen ligase [Rubripirellula amarantea]
MIGLLVVYGLFGAAVIAALFRPIWGLAAFYFFVFLQPEWNWHWSVPADSGFQKYIFGSLIVGWAIAGFSGNRFQGWFARANACLVGFLLLSFVSAQQSVTPELTSVYMDNLWKIVVLSVLTARITDTPGRCFLLFWAIAIGSAYNAFRINEEYFQLGFCRYVSVPWGFKGDSNVYSVFTMPAIVASLSLAIFSGKIWQRSIAGGIVLLQLHQIMLMESRGAMLGIVLIAIVAIFLMPKTTETICIAVVSGILVAVLAGAPVIKEFMSTFESEEQRDTSANSRFLLWRAAWKITEDNLLLGVGPYAVKTVIPQYETEYANETHKAPHNLFLEISAGSGVPSLLLYLCFFLIPWWRCLRTYRHRFRELGHPELLGLFAISIMVPGYFLSSSFSSGALLESSYAIVAIGAGICASIDLERASPQLAVEQTIELTQAGMGHSTDGC